MDNAVTAQPRSRASRAAEVVVGASLLILGLCAGPVFNVTTVSGFAWIASALLPTSLIDLAMVFGIWAGAFVIVATAAAAYALRLIFSIKRNRR